MDPYSSLAKQGNSHFLTISIRQLNPELIKFLKQLHPEANGHQLNELASSIVTDAVSYAHSDSRPTASIIGGDEHVKEVLNKLMFDTAKLLTNLMENMYAEQPDFFYIYSIKGGMVCLHLFF